MIGDFSENESIAILRWVSADKITVVLYRILSLKLCFLALVKFCCSSLLVFNRWKLLAKMNTTKSQTLVN